MAPVMVSVQASPSDRASWLRLAAEVEAGGFAGLLAADHPGQVASPFVALAAAAGVTERIQLGTCVVNAGHWTPMALASEVATLDVVSAGRAALGVGAGHTPQEWTATGLPFPPAEERIDRMIEVVEATYALLDGGPVSYRGEHVTLVDADLEAPRPVQARVPLTIGGNSTRLLGYAAGRADVVGVTGLGRTLGDGHSHGVDWSPEGLRRIIRIVEGAGAAGSRRPVLEALVQHVEITPDRVVAAGRLAGLVPGASVDDLLAAPFVWLGTVEEIGAQLHTHARDLGIDRYVIRGPALDAGRRVLRALV